MCSLKDRFKPTDRARETQVTMAYQRLKRTPRSTDIETWLDNWELVYSEAEEINLPEINGDRPLYDFLFTVKPLDAAFSAANLNVLQQTRFIGRTVHYNSDSANITLEVLIQRFRDLYRMEQAAQGKSRGIFATLAGMDEDGNILDNDKDNMSMKPNKPDIKNPCPCQKHMKNDKHKIHDMTTCYYLNPKIRPKG